ncbi:MAG: luciferase [Halanaeroarchaeum sp.]
MLNSHESVGRVCQETQSHTVVDEACLDGVAIKPTEVTLDRVASAPFRAITIDYEGHDAVPDAATLTRLAGDREVRVTVPVRADGFDPLGDDWALEALPETVSRVFVAGNPAYLDDHERDRAIAPRLGAAVERDEDCWVGTEGIERLALATGATQFELLSRNTDRAVRGLRAAGFGGDVAVYAPTVLTEDDDAVLDALGGYVSRRKPVARALPEGAPTDSTATGRARSVLLSAARDFALVGSVETVRERVTELREAGVDTVVGYPARGLDEFVA